MKPRTEYLSSTDSKQNDNLMLLLDENWLSDNKNPLFLQNKGNLGVNQNNFKNWNKNKPPEWNSRKKGHIRCE